MGLKSFLGGKPSSQSSKNVNNDLITSNFGNTMGYANQAGSLMSALLGGDTSALNAFAKSGGEDFLMQEGQKAITSSKAAQGLLNSGSYGTALEKYGQGLASTYLNQYMQGLQNLGQLGLGAGNIVSGAGETQKSTGAKEGLIPMAIDGMKAAGSMGATFSQFSDRRLKKDVVKLGEYSDGLGKYSWTYKTGYGLPKGTQIGVMADEVKTLRPWAYIPNLGGGFAGVDYGRLNR